MTKTLTEQAAVKWLREAARAVPGDQSIVELGVYQGGSLAALCVGSRAGNLAPVYGVDSWGTAPGIYQDRPHMLRRYTPADKVLAEKATGGYATLIHNTTVDAAVGYDGPAIGLLYIDAEHREHAVLADFHAWRPYLAPDAVVAFDDYEPSRIGRGVIAGVTRLIQDGYLVKVRVVGSRLMVCGR